MRPRNEELVVVVPVSVVVLGLVVVVTLHVLPFFTPKKTISAMATRSNMLTVEILFNIVFLYLVD